MKKLLAALDPKLQLSVSSTRSTRATPSTSTVLEAKCIFCDKTSKYIKGHKTREPLIKCSELRADNSILDAAIKKLDDRMIAIASRELVATTTDHAIALTPAESRK